MLVGFASLSQASTLRQEKLSNNLGRILKQRRVMVPLTLQELAHASGISPSYLGRIERGERFPSAHVLRRIASPLGLTESELFILAGYLTSPATKAERPSIEQLDPYVALALSQEPVEIQRTVVAILTILKSMAKALPNNNSGDSAKEIAGMSAEISRG